MSQRPPLRFRQIAGTAFRASLALTIVACAFLYGLATKIHILYPPLYACLVAASLGYHRFRQHTPSAFARAIGALWFAFVGATLVVATLMAVLDVTEPALVNGLPTRIKYKSQITWALYYGAAASPVVALALQWIVTTKPMKPIRAEPSSSPP